MCARIRIHNMVRILCIVEICVMLIISMRVRIGMRIIRVCCIRMIIYNGVCVVRRVRVYCAFVWSFDLGFERVLLCVSDFNNVLVYVIIIAFVYVLMVGSDVRCGPPIILVVELVASFVRALTTHSMCAFAQVLLFLVCGVVCVLALAQVS